MSTIEKSNNPSLESEDFGDPVLNEGYLQLPDNLKEELKQVEDTKTKVYVLKIMMNKDIMNMYNKLSDKSKETVFKSLKVDKTNISKKYGAIKNLYESKLFIAKQKKEVEDKKPKIEVELQEGKPQIKTAEQVEPPKSDAETIADVKEEAKMKKLSEKKTSEKKTSEKKTDEEKQESRDIKSEELFGEDESEFEIKPPTDKTQLQKNFDNLVKTFYSVNPYVSYNNSKAELEVRFGTRGIKNLTKNDYDNVIKTLKSFGFYSLSDAGENYLRINCEFLDNTTGRFKLSDVRVEIVGLHIIQEYCKNNDIESLERNPKNTTSISFINKKPYFIDNKKIFPVNNDDFNFRLSLSNEVNVKKGIKYFVIENWKKSKKIFRYINRVSFKHDDYPFDVDISIVKYGIKEGREQKRVYTTQEADVFNSAETYEIEIEVDNRKIGPGTKFTTPELLSDALRKVIKYVLIGLQGTNYPISYPEQTQTLGNYMKMIWKDDYDPNKRVDNKNFIGPNSITLQLSNISPTSENNIEPNIRKDFVVTDKADGDRHLMYIGKDGYIYLINTNMNVIFTGARTDNKECFNALLDGELILHDKNGKFINLYAAFDIYYIKNEDIRNQPFLLFSDDKNYKKSRYHIMKEYMSVLDPLSIMMQKKKHMEGTITETLKKYRSDKSILSPIRIVSKDFYPLNKDQTIFSGCNEILSKVRENRFEYETDGLIFSHAHFGVGSEKVGVAGPKTKITWGYSFKWKPPKYNTIDFLITTVKGTNGDDLIKPIFEDGISASSSVQLSEYKMIQLRCGFNENVDGYINPCQDIIDDKLPEFKNRYEDNYVNEYIPMQFYPTDPYDAQAGLCNIMLKMDSSGAKQMFSEENEVFTDNTIVEFRYDFSRNTGWRWVPLRVRYDKTAEYRLGKKQYGNAYKVANENWKSIHNPITEDMICTGMNIPDLLVSEDIYYNTKVGKFTTEAMKNFHNLYVKKHLIKAVAKQGDTLIDFACGKAGDLPKWIASKLSFVFGIDISKDNLENRINGACTRYLNSKKSNKHMPYALFVNGNSSYNVKKGDAMLNDKAKQITLAVFGVGQKDSEKLGKGVARQYGVGEDGFNVSSCQFAIHYFLENSDTLQGFMRNIAECTKLNGYFIGTGYDGKTIFNLLKRIKTDESIKIVDGDKPICEITKKYGADTFEDNSSSIGYKIDVYQESINQHISEYLVNFDYLDRIMEMYGFKIVPREEAQSMGLPEGTGMFSEMFLEMLDEIKRNKSREKDYGDAPFMSEPEKKISFLNRYFVYKKVREVNTQKIYLELSEYNESEIIRNASQTDNAVNIAKEEFQMEKPKIRKISKKLLLVPATEAVHDLVIAEKDDTTEIKKAKQIKQTKQTKKATDVKDVKEVKERKKTEKKDKPSKITKIKIQLEEDD